MAAGFWQTMIRPAPTYRPLPQDAGYNPSYNALPGILEAIGEVPAAVQDIYGRPPIEAAIAARPATPKAVQQPSPFHAADPQVPEIEQAIQARSVSLPQGPTEALRQGAFQAGPAWTGVGGGARTAGQLEQDIKARGLLGAENALAQQSIQDSEAFLGDPMERAIAARGRTLAYERSLPFGSRSRVGASFSGMELGGDYGDGQELGAPTTGEALNFDRAIALRQAEDPKASLEIERSIGRRREMQKLAQLAQINKERVAEFEATKGVRGLSKEHADAEMQRALAEAARKGALDEGDFGALAKLLYPGAGYEP